MYISSLEIIKLSKWKWLLLAVISYSGKLWADTVSRYSPQILIRKMLWTLRCQADRGVSTKSGFICTHLSLLAHSVVPIV